MRTWTAEPATGETFVLAEGPSWDAVRSRLLWVDIEGHAVLEGRLVGRRVEVTGRDVFDGLTSAVSVAADGRKVVAVRDRLVLVDVDGTRRVGPRIVPEGERRRLNDAKADPAGRFLVGTMPLSGTSSREVLVQVAPDLSLRVLDDDLTQANGIAWSVDGSALYTVDTQRRTVFVRDYDVETGDVGSRNVHLRLRQDDGFPDGACGDAEDHLWVAVWGAGQVRRYAPDGTQVGVVSVPAPYTSCAAFAGAGLDLLVITTAREGLTDAQQAQHPSSGCLFTVHVGVSGVPVGPWLPPPSGGEAVGV
jgi:sugar lactone lactonase YvrE